MAYGKLGCVLSFYVSSALTSVRAGGAAVAELGRQAGGQAASQACQESRQRQATRKCLRLYGRLAVLSYCPRPLGRAISVLGLMQVALGPALLAPRRCRAVETHPLLNLACWPSRWHVRVRQGHGQLIEPLGCFSGTPQWQIAGLRDSLLRCANGVPGGGERNPTGWHRGITGKGMRFVSYRSFAKFSSGSANEDYQKTPL